MFLQDEVAATVMDYLNAVKRRIVSPTFHISSALRVYRQYVKAPITTLERDIEVGEFVLNYTPRSSPENVIISIPDEKVFVLVEKMQDLYLDVVEEDYQGRFTAPSCGLHAKTKSECHLLDILRSEHNKPRYGGGVIHEEIISDKYCIGDKFYVYRARTFVRSTYQGRIWDIKEIIIEKVTESGILTIAIDKDDIWLLRNAISEIYKSHFVRNVTCGKMFDYSSDSSDSDSDSSDSNCDEPLKKRMKTTSSSTEKKRKLNKTNCFSCC